MLSVAGLLAFLAVPPAGAHVALSPSAPDSVVVSREWLTLSFAIDSSRGAAHGIELRGSYLMLAVDNDQLSSPRLMMSFAQPSSASTFATGIQAKDCRALTAKYTCSDSTRAEIADGRIVITIQHSAMIEWLFRERPTAVWVRASFASARAGYLGVRYIDPPLPSPSKDSLARQDSVAAREGWGPWTRMMWTSSFAALDPVWMQVGQQVSAYLGEMQCRPIDSCNYRTDFAASDWTSSDSSVVKLTVTDNPRRAQATITALRPGRSTVTVEGLHGPSDDLPRSTRIRAFTRHIVVTKRLARLQITPRPTTIRVGSPVKLEAQLLDESGVILLDAPINFLVIYDWPDNKSWGGKWSDPAVRENLTTPGHRRFIAYFAGLADTLDLEVVPREAPPASHQGLPRP